MSASPWTNPTRALDVNNDGFITPIDALVAINRINDKSRGPGQLPAIQAGQLPPYYYDTSGDGSLTAIDVLQIINRLNSGRGGAQVTAALSNDTAPAGLKNSDGITSDPSMGGQVTVSAGLSALVSLQAQLDDLPEKLDLQGSLDSQGWFAISLSQLNQLAGGTLDDGEHTLTIVARDELAYATTARVKFTLDRVGEAPDSPDMVAESDTGASDSDNITKLTTPSFIVAGAPASVVTLFVNGVQVAQGSGGTPISIPALPDGDHEVYASIIDAAGNVGGEGAPLQFRVSTVAPLVELVTQPYTPDLTPHVRVALVTDAGSAANAPFAIDVDLNNDGDYDDAGELNYTQAQLNNGLQEIGLARALPSAQSAGYVVAMRARVADVAGNEGTSAEQKVLVDQTMVDTLKNYVAADDGAYGWTKQSEFNVPGATIYVLDLKSQKWRNAADFTADETLWQHWVSVIVPSQVTKSTALLLIDGGDKDKSPPTVANFNDSDVRAIVQAAVATNSIAVHVPMIPREPVWFADDPTTEREEDAIIAYTFDKFLNNPDPNSDWPLLLPMVKSAVKAMDAAQEFLPTVAGRNLEVDDFVVTGASKRGWTTWLTAAVDDRVRGIMPMVFDALNLGAQMEHHYGVYNFFSQAIADYNDSHIFDRILTPQGQMLGKVVDPYSYLNNGRFDIPKLIVNSAGDEFFVSDSSQYYFDDLPGENNYLLYLPNTGHGLDISAGLNSKTAAALTTFYEAILNNRELPKFSWSVLDDGTLRVETEDTPLAVTMWQATNQFERDFRNAYTGLPWSSSTLFSSEPGVYYANVPMPATGATAYFVELTFPSPLRFPYRFTTQIVVSTDLPLHPWPFDSGFPLPTGSEAGDQSPVASLALPAGMQITSLSGSMAQNVAKAPSNSLPALVTAMEAKVADTPIAEFAPAARLAGTSFGSYQAADAVDLAWQDSDEWFSLARRLI